MKTILLRIFLFAWLVPAFAAQLPVAALVETTSMNVSAKQLALTTLATRFALQQTGLFRVLSVEEVDERFAQVGEDQPATCLTERCHRKNAAILKADVLAIAKVSEQNSRIHIQLIIRQGATGAMIGSIQLSLPDSQRLELERLSRSTVKIFFGLDSLQNPLLRQLDVQKDSLELSPRDSQWASGLLLLATAFTGAGFTLGGQFLHSDKNTLADGFSSQDTGYSLSGIPGFFGLPSPHARARALSGAGVAAGGESGQGLPNPAGLCGRQNQELSFSTLKLPANSGSQFLAQWSSPLRTGTWWAQEILFSGDDLASEMTFTSSFAWDFALLSSWMTGIEGGVSLKGLVVQVGQGGEGLARSTGSGVGASADLGLQWQAWNGPRFGMLLKDLSSRVSYRNTLTNRTYHEGLPTTLTMGTSWMTPWNTQLNLDLQKAVLIDQYDQLRLGVEQNLFNTIALRVGLRQVMGTDIRTWSLGGGISASLQNLRFQINVAYESGVRPYDVLAASQIFSLALEF